jgi:pescadillo protein
VEGLVGQRQQQPGASTSAAAGGGGGDQGEVAVADGAAVAGGGLGLVSGDDDGEICSCLFKGLVFFLAREVPREPLLFIIR